MPPCRAAGTLVRKSLRQAHPLSRPTIILSGLAPSVLDCRTFRGWPLIELLPDWTYRSAFLERMPRQTRHLHAHAVNRSVCGEKERLHVRSAKGEIGWHFGRLDRADMSAVRRVNPGA